MEDSSRSSGLSNQSIAQETSDYYYRKTNEDEDAISFADYL